MSLIEAPHKFKSVGGNKATGLAKKSNWCRRPESNWLRPPFQGGALPLSYPGTEQILETRSVRVKLSVE
jgi:hypothetical protein